MNIFLALHILARDYADRFKSTFEPGLFLTAVTSLVMALLLLNQTPPPSDAKFIGIVDAIAQGEIMGVRTPVAFLYASFLFLLMSMAVKAISFKASKKPKRQWISDKAADIIFNVFMGFLTLGFAVWAIYCATNNPNAIITIDLWVSAFASFSILSGFFWFEINRAFKGD